MMKKQFLRYGTYVLSLLLVSALLLTGCGVQAPDVGATTTVTDGESTTTAASVADAIIGTTTAGTADGTTVPSDSEDATTADTDTADGTTVGGTNGTTVGGTDGTTGTTAAQDGGEEDGEFVAATVPTFTTTKKTTTGITQPVDAAITKPDSGALTTKSKALSGKNGKLTGFKVLTAKPTAYELLEFEMDVPTLPDGTNVYKEDEVDITATFVSSAGTKLTVDAFYYREYKFNKQHYLNGIADTDPTFRLRVNPQGSGTWDLTVTLAVKGQTVDTLAAYVNVVKNKEGSQVLQVEPNRKQNFMTVSGTVLPMIGQNIAWNTPNAYTVRWGSYIADQMRYCDEYGANYARIWDYMDAGGRLKAGVHEMHQDSSAMWDYLFETADELDYYINFTLMNHGEVSSMVDARWDASIWHTNQGGYITDASEFYTDQKTRDAFKTYLRYVVSRWGYSEYVMSWELFNEIDHTDAVIHSQLSNVRAWLSEMADYIREIDPYHHMVSNSTGRTGHALATYSVFDFIYYHVYDATIGTKETLQKNNWLAYKKPVLIGESGIASGSGLMGGNLTADLVSFHQDNWEGLMGGGAGTSMNWYWDALANVGGQWDYQILSELSARIPWNDPNMFMANRSSLSPSHSQISGMGYRGKTYAYLWFYDTRFTPLRQQATTFKNESASISLDNGTYQVRWVDSWTGKSLKKETVTVTDGVLQMKMPKWSRDVAVAITTK